MNYNSIFYYFWSNIKVSEMILQKNPLNVYLYWLEHMCGIHETYLGTYIYISKKDFLKKETFQKQDLCYNCLWIEPSLFNQTILVARYYMSLLIPWLVVDIIKPCFPHQKSGFSMSVSNISPYFWQCYAHC